jgi:hypothetical protein
MTLDPTGLDQSNVRALIKGAAARLEVHLARLAAMRTLQYEAGKSVFINPKFARIYSTAEDAPTLCQCASASSAPMCTQQVISLIKCRRNVRIVLHLL